MRIAYLDESGTPEETGGTSHFVLLALSINAQTWKEKDRVISAIKATFGLEQGEIHAAWMARRYLEQERIAGFAAMGRAQRRAEVKAARNHALVRKAAIQGPAAVKWMRKNFEKTDDYIHLTLDERREFLRKIADAVAQWPDARIFAECTEKAAYAKIPGPTRPLFDEAFDQVVTRFHHFLRQLTPLDYGMLVQDHNETVADRLTQLMRRFHREGTRWTARIPFLVETPLFVDSRLTSLVQVADLCAYAFRRYVENNEIDLFDRVFPSVDEAGGRRVGARHYRGAKACPCRICQEH